MAYNWSGKYYAGAMRDRRIEKRSEAEERNAKTVHERTKRHRLGTCECVQISEAGGKRRKRRKRA